MEARKQREKAFELAERFRSAIDPDEAKRLGDELGRSAFGEARKLLGVRSRTEAVHVAPRDLVALKRFKALMKRYGAKLSFAGLDQ